MDHEGLILGASEEKNGDFDVFFFHSIKNNQCWLVLTAFVPGKALLKLEGPLRLISLTLQSSGRSRSLSPVGVAKAKEGIMVYGVHLGISSSKAEKSHKRHTKKSQKFPVFQYLMVWFDD